MKRNSSLLRSAMVLFIALLQMSISNAQTWLWPMAGHKAGEKIVSPPNSHIEKEFNCCDLFIGGEEGDVVLCPVDGTVISVGISYIPHMGFMKGFGVSLQETWNENISNIASKNKDIDPKYLVGDIRIQIADGRKVFIMGLKGEYYFRNGQTISAGDTIGQLSYSYRGIRKPSLLIGVSLPNNMNDDPLSPFGVESKFHLDIVEREDPLPVEKMREDLTFLEKAILELYPSLNERMSDSEFHDTMDALRRSVTKPVPLNTQKPIVLFSHLLHDSHLSPMPDRFDVKANPIYVPVLIYSWCDDTLRVVGGYSGYEQYVGRVVANINGIAPRDYADKARQFMHLYDHNVQSAMEEKLTMLSFYCGMMNLDATTDSKDRVVFANGEEVEIPFCKYPFELNIQYTPIPRILSWRNINVLRDPDSVYTIRQINDSTAYLSLRSFNITDDKLERIIRWIGECKSSNMIIDLRSNPGGEPSVLNKLLSCFAQQPLNRQRGGHLYVKKKGSFEMLQYSENHTKDEILFPDYVQLKGKSGYYSFDSVETSSCILPDSSHQYTGRVYVLTNGSSMSAATIFPSVLVRNRRGVSVGRETGSAYHYITAIEKAFVCLPNTLRTIEIPMVKVVFDTTVCARTPWGRGLLPDYELPLTYNEITMGADGETDVMLEYALKLIADGKYLSDEDPFAEADAPKKANCLWIWMLVSLGMLALVVVVLFRRNKNKK